MLITPSAEERILEVAERLKYPLHVNEILAALNATLPEADRDALNHLSEVQMAHPALVKILGDALNYAVLVDDRVYRIHAVARKFGKAMSQLWDAVDTPLTPIDDSILKSSFTDRRRLLRGHVTKGFWYKERKYLAVNSTLHFFATRKSWRGVTVFYQCADDEVWVNASNSGADLFHGLLKEERSVRRVFDLLEGRPVSGLSKTKGGFSLSMTKDR